MSALFVCLTQQHDLRLVVLAVAICALGAWTAFALADEALRARSMKWGAAAAFSATAAIWATHFIAMLAFQPGLEVRFAVVPTVASFFVALFLALAAAMLIASPSGAPVRIAAGVVAGLAISSMHYVGMSAFHAQGQVIWDWRVIVASSALGVGFSVAAMTARLTATRWVRSLAPALLAAAVASDHFVAMTAFTIAPDPSIELSAGDLDRTVLAVLVANVALLILIFSIVAVLVAVRDRRRTIAEHRRMREFANLSVEGLLICEGRTIWGLNTSLELMAGADRRALLGKPLDVLLTEPQDGSFRDGEEADASLRLESGALAPVKVISRTVSIAGETRTVYAVRDQRDRLKAETAMRRLAHEDTLTKLANRLSFTEDVARRFAAKRERERHFALLMLDLDRFKSVNDTLGHGVGDELLKRVAGRLAKTIRDTDLLARLGGDEFAIVTAGSRQATDVAPVAERILEILSRPFLIEGHLIEIGVSVGIAFAHADGSSTEDLSRSADLALYRAKEEGRGAYRFFEGEMNARMQSRRAFEQDLRRAISRQQLRVMFQPQIDSVTGEFDGAEALVRWIHPERGLVSPADFIPLAEELGLISAIGEFVLRRACMEAVKWPDHLTVAVNLSPVQLRDEHLVHVVSSILEETGLPGRRLELELTESALLRDEGRALAVMRRLKEIGVRISMDDFGTGYSSISYLRTFPFDKLKIDQSFVRQLPHDRESMAIVGAVARLGVQLGMKVTAEGVENAQQRQFTAAQGCHQLQGYLFSKPIEPEAVERLFLQTPILLAANA